MELLQLGASPRSKETTPAKIRRSGMIPAIVYGKDIKPVSIKVPYRDFEKVLMKGARHHIVNLSVEEPQGITTYPVMVKEIQMDAVKGKMIHVDFHKVSLLEKIHAMVPVVLTGAEDVEKRGGIIQHQEREVEVNCLPTEIPDRVVLDVSGMNIGDHITIGDLKLPSGVEAVEDPDTIVITIVAPRRAEEEEKPAAEAAEVERTEPEVIGKKPEEKEKEKA